MSSTLKHAVAPTDLDAQSSGSGPESLDLDYDDWEGQFEFVGPSAASAPASASSASVPQRQHTKGKPTKTRQHVRKLHASSDGLDEDDDEVEDDDERVDDVDDDDDEDDDLNLSVYVPNDRRPVLYDEETFLSLNPNDFEDPLDSIASSTPTLCIENCRTTLMKKSNLDGLNNNSGRKFVSAKFHAEELNNIKNRLLADELSSIKGNMKPNNQLSGNHNNEFAADLCDNLTEQVRWFAFAHV